MIVIVSGSRFGYDDKTITSYLDQMYAELSSQSEQLVIREGCARGVDEQVEQWGFDNNADHIWARSGRRSDDPLVIEHWPAEWHYHQDCWCKSDKPTCNYAGHRRNREMAEAQPRPDRVVGFHKDIMASKGTRRMVEIAEEKKIPYEVIGSIYLPSD